MDTTPITRAEHEEFAKRIEENKTRTDRRLELLEESMRQFNNLAISVEKLATNMEQMATEQKQQNDKLEKLEGRDGEMWRKVTGYIITAIIGIVIGFVFQQIGM